MLSDGAWVAIGTCIASLAGSAAVAFGQYQARETAREAREEAQASRAEQLALTEQVGEAVQGHSEALAQKIDQLQAGGTNG